MSEPIWIAEARKHIGVREIPGEQHEPMILRWWKAIKRGGIKTDEVPWCAAFVGGCLEAVGIASSRYESAKSYMNWGIPVKYPCHGCIVVFSREGGGHVGFVVGVDERQRLMVLGGNQKNMVSIAPFERIRVVGYRWPETVKYEPKGLAVIASSAQSSDSEA